MGVGNYGSSIPESVTFRGVTLGDLAEPIEIDWGFKDKDVKAVNTGEDLITAMHAGCAPTIIVAVYEYSVPAIFQALFAGFATGGAIDSEKIKVGHNKGADSDIYGALVVTPAFAGQQVVTFTKAIPAPELSGRFVYRDDVGILKMGFKALKPDGAGKVFTTVQRV